MFFKVLINTIIIILVTALELAFVKGLPVAHDFNLVLVTTIFILGIGGFDLAIWWAVGAGLLLDIYSFMPFGVHMLALALTILALHFLLENFFTNRSLYAFLALTFFGTVIYEIAAMSASRLLEYFAGTGLAFDFSRSFWSAELGQTLFNIAGAFVGFYLFNFISDKLKPVFLMRK